MSKILYLILYFGVPLGVFILTFCMIDLDPKLESTPDIIQADYLNPYWPNNPAEDSIWEKNSPADWESSQPFLLP